MASVECASALRDLARLLLGGAQQPSVITQRANEVITFLENVETEGGEPLRDHLKSVMLNVGYLIPERRDQIFRLAIETADRFRKQHEEVDISWREFAQLPLIDRQYLRDLAALLDDLAERLDPSVGQGTSGVGQQAPLPFVPNKFQRQILQALTGRSLTKQQLAIELCGGEGTRLYNGKTRKGDINELRDLGKVANKPRLGFYRPDAPPPDAIGLPQTRPK